MSRGKFFEAMVSTIFLLAISQGKELDLEGLPQSAEARLPVESGNILRPGLGMVYKDVGLLHNNLDRLQAVVVIEPTDWNGIVKEPEVHPQLCKGPWLAQIFEGHSLKEGPLAIRGTRLQFAVIRACDLYWRAIGRIRQDNRAMMLELERYLPMELARLFPAMAEDIMAPLDASGPRSKRSADGEGSNPGDEQGTGYIRYIWDLGVEYAQRTVGRVKRAFWALLGFVKEALGIGKVITEAVLATKKAKRLDRVEGRVTAVEGMLATHVKQYMVDRDLFFRAFTVIDSNLETLFNEIDKINDWLQAIQWFAELRLELDHIVDRNRVYTYRMLQPARDAYRKAVEGLRDTASGRLSPKLINATELALIIEDSFKETAEQYPNYKPVKTQLNHYYEMKLISMFYDPETGDIYITFPIFLTQNNNYPMRLFEIETAHVPIPDLNVEANSYTRIIHEKPYIAVNHDHYIQLTLAELNSCKHIAHERFCEERFLVKHKSEFTCESAVFFNLPDEDLRRLCTFNYYYNKTVTPSILDGRDELVLANLLDPLYLRCNDDMGKKPLPAEQSSYTIIPKSLLCNCDVETDRTFVQKTLSACTPDERPKPVKFQANRAVLLHWEALKEFTTKDGDANAPEMGPTGLPTTFSIELFPVRDPVSLKEPSTLRELLRHMNSSWIEQSREVPQWFADINHQTVKHSGIWTTRGVLVLNFVTSLVTAAIILAVLFVCIRQKYIYSLLASPAIMPRAAALADELSQVACTPAGWTWFFFVTSMIGLAYMIWTLWEKRTFCRGRSYNVVGRFRLMLANTTRLASFPLVTTYGPYHEFSINQPINVADFQLSKGILWDELMIDWRDVRIQHNERTLALPCKVIVPLLKRWQIRAIFSSAGPLMISGCLDQGGFRYHLPLRYKTLVDSSALDLANEHFDGNKPLFRHLVSTIQCGDDLHF